MEALFGIMLLLALAALGVWSHKIDIAKYGPVTWRDRRNTLISALVAFVACILLFRWSAFVFLLLMPGLCLYFHFSSLGQGQRGWYRQMRDGAVVGWLAALPVCLMLW